MDQTTVTDVFAQVGSINERIKRNEKLVLDYWLEQVEFVNHFALVFFGLLKLHQGRVGDDATRLFQQRFSMFDLHLDDLDVMTLRFHQQRFEGDTCPVWQSVARKTKFSVPKTGQSRFKWELLSGCDYGQFYDRACEALQAAENEAAVWRHMFLSSPSREEA